MTGEPVVGGPTRSDPAAKLARARTDRGAACAAD